MHPLTFGKSSHYILCTFCLHFVYILFTKCTQNVSKMYAYWRKAKCEQKLKLFAVCAFCKQNARQTFFFVDTLAFEESCLFFAFAMQNHRLSLSSQTNRFQCLTFKKSEYLLYFHRLKLQTRVSSLALRAIVRRTMHSKLQHIVLRKIVRRTLLRSKMQVWLSKYFDKVKSKPPEIKCQML